jgi:hypothetical protein
MQGGSLGPFIKKAVRQSGCKIAADWLRSHLADLAVALLRARKCLLLLR